MASAVSGGASSGPAGRELGAAGRAQLEELHVLERDEAASRALVALGRYQHVDPRSGARCGKGGAAGDADLERALSRLQGPRSTVRGSLQQPDRHVRPGRHRHRRPRTRQPVGGSERVRGDVARRHPLDSEVPRAQRLARRQARGPRPPPRRAARPSPRRCARARAPERRRGRRRRVRARAAEGRAAGGPSCREASTIVRGIGAGGGGEVERGRGVPRSCIHPQAGTQVARRASSYAKPAAARGQQIVQLGGPVGVADLKARARPRRPPADLNRAGSVLGRVRHEVRHHLGQASPNRWAAWWPRPSGGAGAGAPSRGRPVRPSRGPAERRAATRRPGSRRRASSAPRRGRWRPPLRAARVRRRPRARDAGAGPRAGTRPAPSRPRRRKRPAHRASVNL